MCIVVALFYFIFYGPILFALPESNRNACHPHLETSTSIPQLLVLVPSVLCNFVVSFVAHTQPGPWLARKQSARIHCFISL